jgi:predicted DNA-binding protein
MYSPRIDTALIPRLYRIAKTLKKPMTILVNEMVSDALVQYEDQVLANKTAIRRPEDKR